MQKYWVFFLQNVHDFLIYRVRLLLVVVSEFVAPLVMIWLFTGLAARHVSGMTKEQLLSYYLFTSILFLFTHSNIDSFVSTAIQHGELAGYLVKPLHFWLVAFIKDFSSRILKLIIGLPFFIVLVVVYSKFSFHFSVFDLITTLAIITLSFLLSFALAFSLGLLTFWVEEVWGFQNLEEVMVALLGGVALPYQFFPIWLQKFLQFTPFPYLVNWAVRKGFTGNLLFEFMMAMIWLFILSNLAIWMWKKGIKKYSALGTY